MTNTAGDVAAVFARRASELEEACIGLGDDDAAKRPSPQTWCVREHLSHLHGDDRETFLTGIQRVLLEDVRELDVEEGITHYTIDRRRIALPALVSAVAGQYRGIADLASKLNDEEIGERLRIELLKATPFGETPTLGEWLVAIADMHLPDHISQIRETRAMLGA
jgi:hypothetical protein